MDDYLIALQFAEDLMKFSLATYHLPWEKPEISFYNQSRSPFNEDIGLAILSIIDHNLNDVYNCHKDLTDMGARTAVLFSRYAFEAAPTYFSKGYSPEVMLCFCAMLVGVAVLMFEYPSNGIAECTSEVIGTILSGHILTGEFKKHGGYERLSFMSDIILKRLANKKCTEPMSTLQ